MQKIRTTEILSYNVRHGLQILSMIRRLAQARTRRYLKTLLVVWLILGLVAVGAVFLPVYKVPRKQYVVSSNGQLVKAPASGSGQIEKTVVEVMGEKAPVDDLVPGNEFARWGVLDYYPGGYHVIYPDGFKIAYTPSSFEADAPGGGAVKVVISGRSFTVNTEVGGLSQPQTALVSAAARLIQSSFQFVSGPGYDPAAAKGRFGN